MSVKKNRLLFLLCLFLTSACYSQQLLFTELLSRPTASGVTIQLIFADSAQVSVEYGTSSGVYPYQTAWQTFPDSTMATTALTGLSADTKYYYRILYRKPGDTLNTVRPEYSFHTQRSVSSPFTFDIEADPHDDYNSDTALYHQCLLNQLADSPDFMIDLGDFLMTDKLQNTSGIVPYDTIPYRCRLFRKFYSVSGNSVPLFIAMGNHEGEAGWYLNGTANSIPVWDAQVRKKYFLNPEPDSFYTGDTTNYPFIGKRQTYYAWQWGDALFIVLDPFWYTNPKPDSLNAWNWSLGSSQYNWLKQTLQNSNATFKFVFSHQLVGGAGSGQGRGGTEPADFYEWGGENIDGTPGFATHRPGWYKPIKDLLTENHVNIFFHGHDHFFAKQQKDCLIYQETPQPSLHNFNYPAQAAQYGYDSGLILSNSGHLRVTVSPIGTQVQYVRVYLPSDTNATHHNGDIAATYFIGTQNCYDSINTGTPVLWNSNYFDEMVFPNPFTTETKISFALDKTEAINLAIFDEQGKLVRTLINGNVVSEGKYDVLWDGKYSYGADARPGEYYYVLQGEKTGRKTGKIVHMK